MNKKGIHSVVAVALLLVVTVVSVVSFQYWFNSYQDSVDTKIEGESDSVALVTISRIETNGLLYIKNANEYNVSVNSINVDGEAGNCSSGNYSGTTQFLAENVTSLIPSGSCTLSFDNVAKVVVITEEGVISGESIVR